MDGESIKNTMSWVRKSKEECRDRLKSFDQIERNIQATCKHDLVYDSRDSHHDWYKCKWCGYEERG